MNRLLSRILGSADKNEKPDVVQIEINRWFERAKQAETQGQWAQAFEIYQQGIVYAQQHGQPRAEQFFLSGLGKASVELKRFDEAERYFREALNLAKHLDDWALVARSLNNIGEYHALNENWQTAQTYHQQAVDKAKASQDRETIILTLESLARDYREQGNAAYALYLMKEALNVARHAPANMRLMASVLGKLGETALLTDEKSAAPQYLQQAIEFSQHAGRFDLVVRWQIALGQLALDEEKYAEARQYYLQAQQLARQVGYQSPQVFLNIALNLAQIYTRSGNYVLAYEEAERAYMHAQNLQNPKAAGQAQALLGLALQGKGENEAARAKISAALQLYADKILDDPRLYMQLLLALGQIQKKTGDTEAALVSFNQVLELAKDYPKRRAEALQMVGMVYTDASERDKGIQAWREAYQLYESAGDKTGSARVLCDIANNRRLDGDFIGAMTDIENALVLLSGIENRVTRGMVLSNAANLYIETGDVETAQSFYKEAISIAQSLHDRYAESLRTGNYGWAQVQLGHYDVAIQTLENAIKIAQELRNNELLAVQSNNLGWAYYRRGEFEVAQNLFHQAQVLAEASANPRWLGLIKANSAMVYLEQEAYDQAEQVLHEALVHSQQDKIAEQTIVVQTRLAQVYARTQRTEEGENLARAAETTSRKMGYKRGQAGALRVLGDIYTQRENLAQAKNYYAQAHKLYQQLSDPNAQEIQLLF